jgi:hypothetical protein
MIGKKENSGEDLRKISYPVQHSDSMIGLSRLKFAPLDLNPG